MNSLLVEFIKFAASEIPQVLTLFRQFTELKGLGWPPDLEAWAEVDRKIDRELKG